MTMTTYNSTFAVLANRTIGLSSSNYVEMIPNLLCVLVNKCRAIVMQ